MRNRRGNILVEFSLGAMIWAVCLAGFLTLSKWVWIKWQALELARLGTNLQASTSLAAAEIEGLLMAQIESAGLSRGVVWSIDLSPPTSVPAFRFYNLVQTRIVVEGPGPFKNEEKIISQKDFYE